MATILRDMRTTVRLDETLMREAKRYAAEQDKTLTKVIEEALREKLTRKRTEPRIVKLRTFDGGGLQPGVDLDDNTATRDLMDGLE